MKLFIALTIVQFLVLQACGTCDPNPDPGQCATQTCGSSDTGNWEEHFACQTDEGEYSGWHCRQEPSFSNDEQVRCESFGDE